MKLELDLQFGNFEIHPDFGIKFPQNLRPILPFMLKIHHEIFSFHHNSNALEVDKSQFWWADWSLGSLWRHFLRFTKSGLHSKTHTRSIKAVDQVARKTFQSRLYWKSSTIWCRSKLIWATINWKWRELHPDAAESSTVLFGLQGVKVLTNQLKSCSLLVASAFHVAFTWLMNVRNKKLVVESWYPQIWCKSVISKLYQCLVIRWGCDETSQS